MLEDYENQKIGMKESGLIPGEEIVPKFEFILFQDSKWLSLSQRELNTYIAKE